MDNLLEAVEMYFERKRLLKDTRVLTPKEYGSKEHIEKLFKLPAGSISNALLPENLPLLISSEDFDVKKYLKKHLTKES